MSVTLHYFSLRARAEPLVMMLKHAGIPFTLKTITFDEWRGGVKDSMPPGRSGERQLPVLELTDGTMMPESLDIAKYIAERATPSLLGEDPAQAERLWLLNDNKEAPFGDGPSLLGQVNPILNFFPLEESEKRIPAYLAAAPAVWRCIAGELRGVFFGGAAPHLGDFALFHWIDHLYTLDGGATIERLGEDGAGLRAWREAMMALPAVAEHLKDRPQVGTGAYGTPASIMATVQSPSELAVVRDALAQQQ